MWLNDFAKTPSLSTHAPAFVGRQWELALVTKCYEASRQRHTQVVLLAGEPGIGKTRLLDEIARRAADDSAVVLHGGTSEAEGMPPYLPFLEALGRYIQDAPLDRLREQVASLSPVLVSILPELAMRLGDVAAPLPLLPEQARFRLYEAVGAFLQSIGLSDVVVFLFDDLHWADTASLDLLCHLARRQSRARLLLVGAYRDCELVHNAALTRTIAELTRQRMLTIVPIEQLSRQEIESLALDALGAPLSPSVAALLFAQSEGNPFFAEEILQEWIETKTLVLEHNQWVAAAPLEQTLPASIVGALRQRFARLSAESIDDLQVAAIIGRTFDLSLLAAVQQEESEVIEERLLEAARARLVQVDQARGFIFSHDKIRECLSAEVGSSRCRRLHGRIGHLLKERYELEETVPHAGQLVELAFHFVRSGDREQGLAFSLRAAAQARQMFAVEEALVHYRTALALLRYDDRRRGALLLQLGEVALMAGKEVEAECAYKDAFHWFAQGEPETLAQVARGLGLARWRQDKRAEALAAFEYALEVLDTYNCTEKVKILADKCVLLTVYMGKHEEGMAYAQRALTVAQELGDAELEARARRMVASNLASLSADDLAASTQFVGQMLSQIEASGDLGEAAECCLNLTVAFYWQAEIKRSLEANAHLLLLVERCGQSHHLRLSYPLLVMLYASQGRWMDAERVIELARPIVDALADPVPAAFLRQFCGFLAYQREDYLVAECELRDAQLDQSMQSGLGDFMFYIGLLGLVQAMMDKEEEAQTYMERIEAHLALLPSDILPTAPLLTCLALTALALGDVDRAEKLYPALLAFRGQHYWFLVDRVLGSLLLHTGRWEEAAQHLAAAEEIARREELRPELARVLVARADLEMGRGGKRSAIRCLLQQALDLFEALGMADSAQRLRKRLRALSHQVRDPSSSPLPARLTKREVAVLKLVAEGKSNGQIARALFLSEKTVTNHLTHIFNKTSCDNRAAATAFAIRNGLA
jgi:predicted ATPase/DNA-binding CsgD family transcriptional regulator